MSLCRSALMMGAHTTNCGMVDLCPSSMGRNVENQVTVGNTVTGIT